MSKHRASWDDPTCALFLDLVQQQKDICHWGHNTPSPIGWSNITHEFNKLTGHGYNKRTLQNKYHDLKRNYFIWRNGQTQTGLGRDPLTGEVSVDPYWLEQGPGESSQKSGQRFSHPQCCEQMIRLLGRTPRDRGQLYTAGGNDPEETPLVTARRLQLSHLSMPYGIVVVVLPPKELLGNILLTVHARRLAKLIPLMKPLKAYPT